MTGPRAAEPQGLEPGRWYWYRFEALGQRSATARTRTAPAAGDAVARLDFLIASCQRWDTGHYAAWRHAAAEGVDLVMFLGDYIYEYPTGSNAVRAVEGGKVRTLSDYRLRHANEARRFNPHIHHADASRRGYVRFALEPGRLQADLRVLHDGRDAASAITTGARYAVDAREPGARPA